MGRKSVLAHIALQMTDQRERAATEGLAFVLANSSAARHAVSHLLDSKGVTVIETAKAEFAVSDESRPDVALFSERGTLVAFLEGKFWASLTDAQPTSYLQRLRENGGTHLLFIVPARRVTSFVHELTGRLSVFQSGSRTNWWHADGVELGVASWREVLDAIEGEAGATGDHPTLSDTKQLRGLAEAMDDEAFIPLGRADVENQDTPRLVMQLSKLIDDAVLAARDQAIVSTDGLRPTHSSVSAGRYICIGNSNPWVGLQHFNWREYGRTPFWLAFGSGGGRAEDLAIGLAGWLNSSPPRAYRHEEYFLVPLFAATGVERDQAIRDLVEQMRVVRDAVDSLKLAPYVSPQ